MTIITSIIGRNGGDDDDGVKTKPLLVFVSSVFLRRAIDSTSNCRTYSFPLPNVVTVTIPRRAKKIWRPARTAVTRRWRVQTAAARPEEQAAVPRPTPGRPAAAAAAARSANKARTG